MRLLIYDSRPESERDDVSDDCVRVCDMGRGRVRIFKGYPATCTIDFTPEQFVNLLRAAAQAVTHPVC